MHASRKFSMRECIFVAEDAVGGGAADAQLARGAELIAAIQVEDALDMVEDNHVEREVFDAKERLHLQPCVGNVGKGEVAGPYDAVCGFKERSFKHSGQLADVAGPVVLEEPGKRAGAEDNRALLIAAADAVEEGLSEDGDIFLALAQGGNREAQGGKAEGEVGEHLPLLGQLAQRSLRGGQQDEVPRLTILQRLEYA